MCEKMEYTEAIEGEQNRREGQSLQRSLEDTSGSNSRKKRMKVLEALDQLRDGGRKFPPGGGGALYMEKSFFFYFLLEGEKQADVKNKNKNFLIKRIDSSKN